MEKRKVMTDKKKKFNGEVLEVATPKISVCQKLKKTKLHRKAKNSKEKKKIKKIETTVGI